MAKKVTTTAAKADLLQMVEEVLRVNQRFVIMRRGKAVAALVPATDLDRMEAAAAQKDMTEVRKIIARLKNGKEKTSQLNAVVERLKR